MLCDPRPPFFVNIEDGLLSMTHQAEPLGFYAPHEVEEAACDLIAFCEDRGFDRLHVICSSSVDFADEYGWPEPTAVDFLAKLMSYVSTEQETA